LESTEDGAATNVDALLESSEDAPATISSIDAAASAVSMLEGELIAAETKPQFDALFRRAHELGRQIDRDETLGPLERGAVDQHLRELLMRARTEYDRRRASARSGLADTADRLRLSEESLADADTIAHIQEVRADLRLIREGLRSANAWAPRELQGRVWEQWQRANQTAWTKLNEFWSRNEDALNAVLERAEEALKRGNPRAAKGQIKGFHELAKSAEGSHGAMKRLRVRARDLWDRATVASKQQHEAYVVIARKRLDHLRLLAERTAQTRRRIEAEVTALETDLKQTQTDVAAALLRGQLEARRKDLRRIDSGSAGLLQRIDEAEKVVT
jgi:hypothetical protein